jgi:hypothetical protein
MAHRCHRNRCFTDEKIVMFHIAIWVNHNNSLTWNKAILGMISLTSHSSRARENRVRSWSKLPRIIILSTYETAIPRRQVTRRSWVYSPTSTGTNEGRVTEVYWSLLNPPQKKTGKCLLNIYDRNTIPHTAIPRGVAFQGVPWPASWLNCNPSYGSSNPYEVACLKIGSYKHNYW